MKKQWKRILFWVLISEAVGGLAGFFSRKGTQIYTETVVKPMLSPPSWVFPVVWIILYALMGISAAMIAGEPESRVRSRGLNLMVAQLAVNFFWPLLFFNAQAYGFSLLWLVLLWGLVLAMVLVFRRGKPLAAGLQIPYLIWLSFALYLNAGVWYLNR